MRTRRRSSGSTRWKRGSTPASLHAASAPYVVFVIPLLVEKDDPDIQWHAKHGIVLMTAEMLLLLGLTVVALVLGLMTAGFGCVLLALVPIPFLAFLVMHIVAVVKAFGGKRLVIPIVSEYADRF